MMSLDALFSRWVSGHLKPLPRDEYPAEWQPLLAGISDQNAALSALGLFSHYQSFQVLKPAAPLTPADLLPVLDTPLKILPPDLWPLLDSVKKRMNGFFWPVLREYLSRKGYHLPPPALCQYDNSGCDIPEFYRPWLIHLQCRSADDPAAADHEIGYWRVLQADELRTRLERSPLPRAKKRAIIRDYIRRSRYAQGGVQLIETLYDGCGADDIPFLTELLCCQWPEIRDIARQLLWLIRALSPGGEALQIEYIQTFFVVSGSDNIYLKYEYYKRTMDAFLARVELSTLVRALDLSPEMIIERFSFSTYHNNPQIGLAFLKTGDHHLIMKLVQRWLQLGRVNNCEYATNTIFQQLWQTLSCQEQYAVLFNQQRHTISRLPNELIAHLLLSTKPPTPSTLTFSQLINSDLWQGSVRLVFNETDHPYLHRALGLWLPKYLRRRAYQLLVDDDRPHLEAFLLAEALDP